MPHFEILDIVVVASAVLAATAALVLVWMKPKKSNDEIRLIPEAFFEAGMATLLAVNIFQFSEDTELFFRKRLKFAIAFIYASALISTVSFIFSTIVAVATLAVGSKSKFSERFSRQASRTSWVMYLVTSIAAFISYMTVSDETDALGNGAGEDAIFYLIGIPGVVATLVLIRHLVSCIWHRKCGWNITTYRRWWMVAMVTVFAILLATTPFLKGREGESDENFTGAIAMYSEILAAFLHRVSLYKDDDEDTAEQENKRNTTGAADAPPLPYPV